MFSLACNLLKMDTYSNNFQNIFLAKNPCDCQIRSNQIVASAEYYEQFPLLINRKDVKDQISKIKTQDTGLYVAYKSQRRQSHLGAS